MIDFAETLDNHDFGDGGAFPEIPLYQYPQGRRRNAAGGGSKALSLTVGAAEGAGVSSSSSTALVAVSASDQLRTKHFTAEELQRAPPEQVAAQIEETRAAVAEKLRSKVQVDSAVRHVAASGGEVDPTYDPLDPTNTKVARRAAKPSLDLARIDAAAINAPIVRSPTKKDAGGSGSGAGNGFGSGNLKQDLAALPSINNYRNTRGIVHTLEERVAASGGLHRAVQISDHHFDMNERLDDAMKAIEARSAQRAEETAAAREAGLQQQAAKVEAEALARLEQRRNEQRELRQTEGALDREALRRAQREQRDREREEERRQRRLQRVAERSGLDVDEVAASRDALEGAGISAEDGRPDPMAAAVAAERLAVAAAGRAARRAGGGGDDEDGDDGNHFDEPLFAPANAVATASSSSLSASATTGSKRKRGEGAEDIFGTGDFFNDS